MKENSNQHFSLQGLNNHITSDAIANYWLDSVYPKHIASAHRTGRMHIHDTGTLGPYCVGWDLTDLLIKGFGGVPSKLRSKPAKHLRTALMQVVNFMYTLQGEAAGAIAFSQVDTLMSPFIREDKIEYQELKQILQEFVFNMNVPTRTGFQSPFTNITLDLTVPNKLKNIPVIVGGKPLDYTYSEVQEEMDMFNRAFAEVMIEGDADGRPFTFPIPTFSITDDFDWDNETLKPIWEMTAKYGIPYFANFVNSDMSPDDSRSMCCRLRLSTDQLQYRGGGLFGAAPLTGSIGVVTINLPRIGFHANGNRDAFFAELDDCVEIARESLVIKRGIVESWTDDGLYPYSTYYLAAIKEETGKYWGNHFSTIGVIGMHEASEYLIGKGIGSDEGTALAKDVLNFIRKKLEKFQQEDEGSLWNLEASPAEGAMYRLAKIDSETLDGATQREYYTNSTNLPVEYTEDAFKALKHQEGLHVLYTGGTVFHVYLGESINDWESVRALVRAISRTFKVPYYTISPTFSICPNDGYIPGEHPVCPKCGAVTEVFVRVVGFLRPVSTFNDGKVSEFEDRTEYKV